MTAAIIASFLAAFARTSAFLFTAPLTGDRSLPVKVRLLAAVAFAVVLAVARGPMAPEAMALALPYEIFIGAAAGFAGRMILAAAEAGGELIGLPFSLGFAATFDPALGESALVTRRIAYTLAGLAFLAAGGLEAGVRVMMIAPPPTEAVVLGAIATIIARSGDVVTVAVRFAAPAVIAGVVANLGIALASRAAPSLNIFSVMLAAMLVVGGLVLITTAPALARELSALSRHAIGVMYRTAGG